MKKVFLFSALLLVGFGCRNETLTPADDGTLSGSFRLEVDPVRCSLPTTNQLTVQPTGADTYRFEYDRFGQGVYHLSGVTAIRDGSSYELSVNGQRIGQYAFEEIRSLNGTQKKWVLMVRHETDKPNGLEFMGVKK